MIEFAFVKKNFLNKRSKVAFMACYIL